MRQERSRPDHQGVELQHLQMKLFCPGPRCCVGELYISAVHIVDSVHPSIALPP